MERTLNFFQHYSTTEEIERESEPYEIEVSTVSEVGFRTREVMESTNIEPDINAQGYAIYKRNLKTIECGVKKQTLILILIGLQFLITVGIIIVHAVYRKFF